jgi:TonB family protein
MNEAALIYRANNRWLIWAALGCALTIDLAAVALAENRAKPVLLARGTEPEDTVTGIIDTQPPPEPDAVSTSEQTVEDQEFTDENLTPRPIRPRKKTPVTPVVPSIGVRTSIAMHFGSMKALTLYAPRPIYPYEARRAGTTGSGVAELNINSESGNVISARMAQSTGSAILDRETLETLQRWRFRSGVASNVRVPITYTLTGVSY